MASVDLNIKVGFIFEPKKCAGEPCRACNDPIYGDGFKMILATNFNDNLLPKFHDQNINICQSCKEAVKL